MKCLICDLYCLSKLYNNKLHTIIKKYYIKLLNKMFKSWYTHTDRNDTRKRQTRQIYYPTSCTISHTRRLWLANNGYR